ncbi:hypothetical protein ACFFRR_001094 [Megaselia abdita]
MSSRIAIIVPSMKLLTRTSAPSSILTRRLTFHSSSGFGISGFPGSVCFLNSFDSRNGIYDDMFGRRSFTSLGAVVFSLGFLNASPNSFILSEIELLFYVKHWQI